MVKYDGTCGDAQFQSQNLVNLMMDVNDGDETTSPNFKVQLNWVNLNFPHWWWLHSERKFWIDAQIKIRLKAVMKTRISPLCFNGLTATGNQCQKRWAIQMKSSSLICSQCTKEELQAEEKGAFLPSTPFIASEYKIHWLIGWRPLMGLGFVWRNWWSRNEYKYQVGT